jgi:cytochrome c
MAPAEASCIDPVLQSVAMVAAALLLASCNRQDPAMKLANADPQRGMQLIERYGCVACHAIPGIDNPGSNVGPPLHKFGLRAYIGGVLPNTPENLVRWLQNPPAVDPRTAMPDLGVSKAEAGDIAAYLHTLR